MKFKFEIYQIENLQLLFLNMKQNKLEIDIDIQQAKEQLPNAASVFLDKQESFNHMRASDKNMRDSTSLGPSVKVDQQAVKVVVHQDMGSSGNSNGDEASLEQLGAFHQLRDPKHSKLEHLLEAQLLTDPSAQRSQGQQPIQLVARENFAQATGGLNTIQIECNDQENQPDLQQDGGISQRQKKRPRKRYFNGHGKVPGKVEAIPKDPNARMSRALSGKSWTRGGNKGATSLSSRSGPGIFRKDPSALTQTQSFRPYQGQFALNFATSDAVSQFTPSNHTPMYLNENEPTVTSQARQRGIRVLSEDDQETEFETLNSRNYIHGQRIKVQSNQVTLDPKVAIQLAQDGAIIGLSNLQKEVDGLSRADPSNNDNGLLFTLDQYKWAQRQNFYERKDSIGKNSLGRQIHSSTQHTRAKRSHQSMANLYPPKQNNSIAPSDFIVEEAAVSHLMHRADNIPKIKFQLVCDQDDTTTGEPSQIGPAPSFSMPRGSVPFTTRTAPKGAVPSNSDSAMPSIVQPNTGLMSPIGRFLMSDTDDIQVDNGGYAAPGESIQAASAKVLNANLGFSSNSRQASGFRQHRSQQAARPVRGTINSDIYRNNEVQLVQMQEIASNNQNINQQIFQQNTRQPSPYRVQTQRVLKNMQQDKLSPTPMQATDIGTKIQYSHQLQNSQEDQSIQVENIKPKRRQSYKYEPLEGELETQDLGFSSGNIYDISKNPSMAKLLSSVQNSIAISHFKRYERRAGRDRVQGMFKKSQSCFHKTLLVAEEQGHCEGISTRDNPTTLYQNRLRTLRFLQKQAERYEEIRAKRPQIQQARRQAQQDRTAQKIYQIEQAKKVVPDWVKLANNRPQQGPTIQPSNDSKQDSGAPRPPQPTIQVNKLTQSAKSNIETAQPRAEQLVNDSTVPEISKINASVEDSRGSVAGTQCENSPSPQKSEVESIARGFSAVQATNIPQTPLHHSLSPSKQKKLAQNNARKLKQLRENLGLKNILPEQVKALEQLLLGQIGGGSPSLHCRGSFSTNVLQKIQKCYQQDQFITFKQSHNRQPGVIPKRNPIFKASEQLGLEDRPDFQQFFLALCADPNSHNPKLERLKYKEFLQDRYSRIVGEKALLFFENKFQTLFTFDKRSYCNVIMEFLNSGTELYKRLLFGCLNFSCSSFVCEHDIFLLLENFKQRDSYYFYKELISQKNVPRDFADAIDGSDDTFFEAFASDVKIIARALALRKRIFGIADSDTSQGFEDDVDPRSFSSEEAYEECMVNQIDYIIGIILKSTTSANIQQDIANLLISVNDLKQLKSELIELAVELDVKASKEKKADTSVLTGADAKRPLQTPCLGANIVAASGKKIQTECCYLSFEDFNKLVTFKKGHHSSFVEDLVDHMTNSLISVHDVEMWLSSYREPTCTAIFSGQTLIEHVAQLNVKHYGNTKGLPPLQAKVKKLRMGIAAEILPHKITTPYTAQDHYMGEDFVGKLLIRKIPAKDGKSILEHAEGEDRAKDEEHGKSPERRGESGDEKDQEGCDCAGSPSVRQKDRQVLNTTLINETTTYELIRFRAFFGAPNFFRVFRLFYQLSNIPEDAQNNPFALYLDEASITRNFESVFGVNNEEVAVRFFRLFISPLDQPKMYKIDLCRWYFVVQNLTDNSSPKTNKNFLKLAFNFLDFDNNGNIGSVDILNLKRSLREEDLEAVEKAFYLISVRKQLGAKMKKRFVEGAERRKDAKKKSKKDKQRTETSEEESVSMLSNQAFRPVLQKKKTTLQTSQEQQNDQTQKNIAIVEEECAHSQDSNSQIDSQNESDEDKADPSDSFAAHEAALSDHERMTRDPWNCFQMEVQILRDHYVSEAVMTQNPKTTDYEFINLKRYELQFLTMLAQRFEIETPTIVHFFKKILVYEFDFSEGFKEEKGSNFYGYTKRGYRMPREVKVTPELLQMQQMLESMSKTPRPPNQDPNHY